MKKFEFALNMQGNTQLSKTFDCFLHDLLIANLHAYDFDTSSFKLKHNYLTNRYLRVKINYSSSVFIKYGVPQGSILDPILFNTSLCDLFLIVKNIDIAFNADGNTPYCTGEIANATESTLKTISMNVF